MPSLRQTVVKDLVEVLQDWSLYKTIRHNRMLGQIDFPNGSIIDYFSVDDEQKIRGRKRDHLYINECNEISLDEYIQLKLRTSGKTVIDFNPSEDSGWFYDLITQPGTQLIRSTYKDNVYLSQSQVDYIESLKETDENIYRVYTLGERPIRNEQVYKHFKVGTNHSFTQLQEVVKTTIGIDWGFNDPTVVVRCRHHRNGEISVKELYRESNKTVKEVIEDIIKLNIKDYPLYCDHRPEIIEQLNQEGFDARKAKKDIVMGIDKVKSLKIFVDESCLEFLDEVKKYSYRTVKSNQPSDNIPLDKFNHGMDALRYALYHDDEPVVSMPNFIGMDFVQTQW